MVHEECLTGLEAWQATVFPSPLCWGASFDPGLVEQMSAHIGAVMRRLGVHQGLAPVLDVVRDLRWGRTEETIGEDPYLVGLVGSGYVRGLESAGIVATLKHFAGYSASRGARNMAPVSIGPRELADVLLPPFEMALRAGARSVMNSYTDLDGVPVAADPEPADRAACGTTTGSPAPSCPTTSRSRSCTPCTAVAGTRAEAAELALQAGIDVELPTVDCFGEPLRAAIEAGLVDEALVDRAAARVLSQKCELGLLDAGLGCPGPDPADGDPSCWTTSRPARWPGRWPAARSSCCRTTARCRCPPGRGSRWSGPGPTRPARCWAATRSRSTSACTIRSRDGHRGADRAGRAAGRPGRVRRSATRRAARCSAGTTPAWPRRRRPPARRTCAWRCSATWPACSAGAPPVRAATRPACGCPAASRNCSRRCWAPAPRWFSFCWWGGRMS